MNALTRLLGLSESAGRVRDPDTVARIVEQLDTLGDRARFVASYAYVLARVAHADSDISEDEIGVMRDRVCEFGGLPESQAEIAVEIATSRALELGSSENYIVTRVFSRSVEPRRAPRHPGMSLLGRRSGPGCVDAGEPGDQPDRVRAGALTHTEVAAVRSRYREHLSVLKTLPR